MKITVIVPSDIDKKTRECLNEIIKQTNLAISSMNRKIEELRSEKNG